MKKRQLPRSSRLNPLGLQQQPGAMQRAGKGRLPLSSVNSKLPLGQRLIQKLNPRNWRWSWKKFFIGLAIFAAVIVVGAAGAFAYFVRDLPNPTKLVDRNLSQSTRIVDRNDKPLYTFFGDKNRTYVTLDKIDPDLQRATIAVEDASFYENSGFAIKGIVRAVVNRVRGSGVTGGGSTITQQFVKNAIQEVATTNGKSSIKFSNRTLGDKVKELILAVEVEQKYSKDDILTGYLNSISYGNNAYGIEQAAQTYFGKSAADLTLSESATLAAIPQLPSYYSPYGTHLDKLFQRKNLVLNRMVVAGFITQEQADAAKAEAPNADNPSFSKSSDLVAPHFVFFVRQQLIDWIGGDEQEAERQLDEGGFVVKTSLDLDAQNLAQGIISDMGKSAVDKYGGSNAALTAVDPNTGEVIAMVGSISYSDSISGNTNFAAADLQPGSSFKPFVYATAFDPEHKMSPASITYDLETDFGGGYKPQNYNGRFNGPITERLALANSLNVPAVKTFALAGIENSINTAHRMGITTLSKDSDYGLSLVLGSGEVRAVDMANAYGAFANGGTGHVLRPILTITKGTEVVKDYTTQETTKAIEPEVAYQITSILSDTNSRKLVFGSLANNFVLPDRIAGAKSGTTQNNRDAWTVGYTPQLSTAVWVGNNQAGKTMKAGADGSVVAAPIWKRFMTEWHKGKEVKMFAQPETIKTLTIDKLSGKLPTDQSPPDQRITDVFAPWQVPTEFDDVHTLVKIDKVSGKLATDLTPPDQIELRYYFRVHSEMPKNPNWEGPVQAWAAANGGGGTPPTEKDDVHTSENRPTIAITSPANASSVNGTFTIAANPGGARAITKVEFFINNVSIGSATSAPWQISYDTSGLPSGSQIIEAVATNDIGLTATAQVTLSKSENTTITLSAIQDLKASTILHGARLSWTNPSSTGLASVNIYMHGPSTSASIGSVVKTVSATPGSSGSVDITPSSGPGTYWFTTRPVDTNGKEGPLGNQVSINIL